MEKEFKKKLADVLQELEIDLSEEVIEKLYDYYELVIEKNKFLNLTAITEEDEFILKHIVDSLSIVMAGEGIKKLLQRRGTRLIDVGTGAGIPGVILKLCFSNTEIVLFDSLKKRLIFLDEVIRELKLEGISTLHGRAEDLGQDKGFRESFDIAVSRAVAPMNVLSEYCLPLIKKNGVFIAYKSGDIKEELSESRNAIRMLGGKLSNVCEFCLPKSDIGRSLILIEKRNVTPIAYPRKAGTPSKCPIR